MVDTLTPAERSIRMSKIQGKNSRPEMVLRKGLHKLGLRYRLHIRSLPGAPDLVFSRKKIVVFVHGCFWHRHNGCKIATTPKSNTEFWSEKFQKNVERDIKTVAQLKEDGWTVIVVWECELNSNARAQDAIIRIADEIRQSNILNNNRNQRGVT